MVDLEMESPFLHAAQTDVTQKFLFLAILLPLVGCQSSVPPPLAIGGAEAEQTIRTAERVSICRLKSNGQYHPTVGDYETEAGPITPSPAVCKQLREIFLKLRSRPSPAKGCVPDFRVQIHFRSGTNDVDVLLCLDCRIMAVYHNTKAFSCDNFDTIAPQLIAIIRDVFPDDPAIRAIK